MTYSRSGSHTDWLSAADGVDETESPFPPPMYKKTFFAFVGQAEKIGLIPSLARSVSLLVRDPRSLIAGPLIVPLTHSKCSAAAAAGHK